MTRVRIPSRPAAIAVLMIVFAMLVPRMIRGQGTLIQKHEETTPPVEARYEIIQSSFIAKMTLRLDRFNGVVDQLVSRVDSTIGWQTIPRRPHPYQDTRILGRANYQIFTSGIAARYTFLINVTTGATWELVEDPDSGWFWTPIL
jgi:hypothetical protein